MMARSEEMLSVFIAIGLICGVALWLYGEKLKNGHVTTVVSCVIFYALTRLLPLLMLEEKASGVWINLAADAVILVFFVVIFPVSRERKPQAAFVYMMNPIVICAMISGDHWYMSAVWIAVVAVCVLIFLLRIRITDKVWTKIHPYYISVCASGYGLMLALLVLEEKFSAIQGCDGEYPVLLIISLFVLAVSLVLFAVKLVKVKRITVDDESECDEYGCELIEKTTERKKFTVKDTVIMLLLTVAFGILVFIGLGSSYAPETYLEKKKNSEIVLDLGSEKQLSNISIYLGYKAKRTVYINTSTDYETWELLNEDGIVETVFRWNDFNTENTARYIWLDIKSDTTVLHEITITDENGALITPANADEFPLLFDEQEMFPDYTTYYYRMMFDEIYHGRTGYEIIHGLPIYEISHPPLGKSIISLGIRLFGMTPLGWRFMSAVFGIMMVPLMYGFAFMLTKRTKYSFLATALLCMEFMHLTLSRIATIDIMIAYFILLMFFLMYVFLSYWKEHRSKIESQDTEPKLRRKLFWNETFLAILCGIASGLAIATKWTGAYAIIGIAVMFAVFLFTTYNSKEKLKNGLTHLIKMMFVCVLAFVIIPAMIYVLSYIQYTMVDDSKTLIQYVIENGEYMLNYHEATVFEHPYSSEWYEWPWIKQPLLDAYTSMDNNTASSVATFGNPVIWWGGIAALLYNLYLWLVKKNKTAGFLCIAYFSMLIPWLMVHRTVFIYQYFVCSIVIVLLICNGIFNMPKYRKATSITVLALSFVLLAIFIPVLTGISVSKDYLNSLEWTFWWVFA